MGKSSTRYCTVFIYIVLALVVFAVFGRLCTYDFICYDDPSYVTENRHVLTGLKWENIVWAFSSYHSGNWHPLTWFSHMLDCQLFGTDSPGLHHLVNLLLHLANTILLFAVLKQMTGALWPSGFVAALFAIHPLHVESVAWIAERKDVLSTLFWILTMSAYLRYVKSPGPGRYVVVFVLFVLGLISKPMLVTLPFVLLLLDYWPLERFEKSRKVLYRLILEKVPLFVLSAISCVVTFVVQRSWGAVANVDRLTLNIRIANALVSYVRYIAKMFWPVRLAVFYPYRFEANLVSQAIAAGLLLLAITVLVVRLTRSHRYLLVGWLWFLGTLVPVIGLVQVGSQVIADRYSYVPFIGPFIIIAWGLPEALAKWRHRKVVPGILATAVLLVLSIYSWLQAGYWRNSITLFEHSLEVTEDNSVAYSNLGNAYRLDDRIDEAIDSYRKSLELNPEHPNTHNNLGIALSQQGKAAEAINHYAKALQLNPDYPEAYYNLGLVLRTQNRLDEAVSCFRKAVQIRPDYAEAYVNLGIAMAMMEEFDESINYFQKALQLAPDNAKAHYNLGLVFQSQGRAEEATNQFRRALQLKPDYTRAHQALEMLLKSIK